VTIDGGWFGPSPAASWIQLQYEGAGDIFFPKRANQTHRRYFCARQLNTSFTSSTAATFFNSNCRSPFFLLATLSYYHLYLLEFFLFATLQLLLSFCKQTLCLYMANQH
uniref:Uncharacterized protein n=1 Tax=Aegilops tauschii subsp. strangulata TaxID=200361 RepID=A0A453I469_AEGTS